jgi:endogenous inhibitor of DNA gyrase (YacG/DUF329 family)
MSHEQKENIKKLRLRGLSYKDISKLMDISVNTVKSFCQRNNMPTGASELIRTSYIHNFCRLCFNEIMHVEGRKQKKFCSDKCRAIWWVINADKLNKKAMYNFICARCGTKFEAYGNKTRKFCSHNCYIEARFGKEDENETGS